MLPGADLPKIRNILKQPGKYLLLIVVLVQCTDSEQLRLNGSDFFPLAGGLYWIYNIQETSYSPLQPPASDTFQLKLQVVDSFKNSESSYTYVLHRFIRQDETFPWQFSDTWSARVTDQYAIVNEENVPVIHLAFPVHINRKWDANLFNSLPADEFTITTITDDSAYPFPVDWVAEVEQENVNNNLTYRDVRTTRYGKNIGLLSALSEVWTYTCSGGTCTGEINSGYRRIQYLQEYGKM